MTNSKRQATPRTVAAGSACFRSIKLAVLSTVLSLICARAVEAKLESRLDVEAQNFGHTVSSLLQRLDNSADLLDDGARAKRLAINGIFVLAQSKRIEAPQRELKKIFGRMKKGCETPVKGGSTDAAPLLSAPQLENFGPRESYLYCLKPQRVLSAAGIEATLNEYGRTGDLSSIGQLQGLYVRSTDQHHQLLMMQMSGPLDVNAAFTTDGDVPGRDHPMLPRPGGRRILSISFDEHPLLNTYASPRSKGEALAEYKATLEATKLSVLVPRDEHGQGADSLIARTMKDTFIVFAHDSPTSVHSDAEQTILSITRLVQ